jgi:hypothetical protein
MTLRNYLRTAFFILSLFVSAWATGQQSKGGMPVLIQKMKSATMIDLVSMPLVDNKQLKEFYDLQADHAELKKLHFAHPFDVSLTPKNSGQWYCDGVTNYWQLRIKSADAYSINLIFSHFKLPENSKLFLIGQNDKILGAFTSENNSASGILATEPLAGDEIMVQYEEPVDVPFQGVFEISRVSHDFLGILGDGVHRPLNKEAGLCNVNVNCDLADFTGEIRNSSCRIIINGADICTGSLINNTANDGKPYLLTAYHCIGNEKLANKSVFLFNYQAPSCSTIDGDVSNSISGSTLKAGLKITDFSLVQLNITSIPANFRPFFAGWNRVNSAASKTFTFSHPQGDVKKIAIDNDSPITSSFSPPQYQTNGFWLVNRWNFGVTEVGSSGAGLFDQNLRLVGTLTAGAANCVNPVNDYFEKFAVSWDLRTDSITRQLKHWLDPMQTNPTTLNGYQPYSQDLKCVPFTNLKNEDTYEAKQIVANNVKKGYYSGTNKLGYTNFAEKYQTTKNLEVSGVSLGIARLRTNCEFTGCYVNLQIYSGNDVPERLIYTETFDAQKLYLGAMNYLQFKKPIQTAGTFFVSYSIEQLHEHDTLVVFMAKRITSDKTNSFFIKDNEIWKSYTAINPEEGGSALVTELIGCNVDNPSAIDDLLLADISKARIFPNPLRGNSYLSIVADDEIDCLEDIAVYDLVGKKQILDVMQKGSKEFMLNFSGKQPGTYLLHFEAGGRQIVGKVVYIP